MAIGDVLVAFDQNTLETGCSKAAPKLLNGRLERETSRFNQLRAKSSLVNQ